MSPGRRLHPLPADRLPPNPLSPRAVPTHLLVPATQASIHPHCLGIPLRFHVVHESLEIHGYQMYAVEKWIVERNRPVAVLVVYTGDPSHKISVFSLSPSPDLTPSEAHAEWDKVLHHLRRDGARPKETPHGVLMATSLAHFRSDYTIVRIPDGNFLAVREQLYTNINLLRMGCSGRSALTLEDPSDATKSRFISTYHLPESICTSSPPGPVTSTESLALPVPSTKPRSHSHSASVLSFTASSKHAPETVTSPSGSISKSRSPPWSLDFRAVLNSDMKSTSTSPPKGKMIRDNSLFTSTVLELVKLIQAGLAIFGMYGTASASQSASPHFDGLLCDETVEGIRRWIIAVGEPCVGIEPMERIADPMFVASLVSLILCVRNKLAALGFSHVSSLVSILMLRFNDCFQIVPKDPFLYPRLFTYALMSYVQSTSPGSSNGPVVPSASPSIIHQDLSSFTPSHSRTHSRTHSAATTPGPSNHGHTIHGFGYPQSGGHIFAPHLHHLPVPPQMTPSTSGSSNSHSHSNGASPPAVVLTRELVEAIGAAYDAKVRATDGRVGGHGGRMRKALRDKLRAGVDSDGDGGSGGFDRERGTTSGGEGGTGDRERESLGGVGTGVASSGGQILSGIGSFASGLGLGVGTGGGGGAVGAGALLEATNDMGWLVKSLYGKDGKGKARKAIAKGKERKGKDVGDPLGVGYGYGYTGREKEKDGGVGVSVRALWSGQVTSITKLREWEAEKERMGASASGSVADRKRERANVRNRDRLALSDGDVDDTVVAAAKSETEEESDSAMQGGGFGGMWGEKVQKKLESWAGLARKRGHMSLDMTTPASRGDREKEDPSASKYPPAADPLSTARSSITRGDSLPLSPTLPPMIFVGSGDGDPDDDDLLSSGQVSPIDNLRPSPFHLLHDGLPLESTSVNNTDYERKVTEFNQKRPWGGRIQQSRVSSWADPVSGRGLLDQDGSDLELKVGGTKSRRRKRGDTISSLLGRASVLSEEPDETLYDDEGCEWLGEYEFPNRRLEMFGPARRRSFHDLESLRGMRILAIERMRVDVELSGQLLIMTRREQHLQNVVACLQVVTSKLSNTNSLLREDYQSHLPFLSNLEAHAQVISRIDAANAKADKTSQATHTLHFRNGWAASPTGVHGAHGPFNRLQWTPDGRERLVDHLGRTESDAEEEEPGIPYLGTQQEDEEDVVEHPGIKPMWLLRFFTSWGARWGAPAAVTQPKEDGAGKATIPETTPQPNGKANGKGTLSKGMPDTKGRKKRSSAGPSDTDEAISPVSLSS
ncbi:hypothetical protein FPV67DRAFT_1604951 [Lyophyllum atratum]|nr:hypothetical protein FPV67DRAFT_1604951 [Lyophyllum atratum]